MNARNLFASLFAVAMLGMSIAQAAPAIGTAKARGDYRPGAYRVQRDSGYHSAYSRSGRVYRSYSAPVAASPSPMVAQAPAEVRRFSYAPSAAGTVTTTPCPEATVPQAGRRYSYAPADTSVAPAPTYAPRAYSSRPSYSGRSRGGSTNPNFPLLKTDPRKYNTR